ncbi:MAG TPA: type IV pilus secretin PilQ [Thermoanaerobaculia bacterium]|nr:type IV pilus secretin PilQ [Thermoanaerobaculia bacterium]
MGRDVVNRTQSVGRYGSFAAAAALAFALVIGCSSSKPARVVEAAPVASTASTETGAAAPVEIRSLDLREGAPEVFVDLEASAPVVWTSFRNADGRVIVELPNSVPAPSLTDLTPEEGLIASLKVEKDGGSRPLTRLVIATRQEVEHSVSAEGTALRVQLVPVEQAAESRLSFEPVEPAAETARGGEAAVELTADQGTDMAANDAAPVAEPVRRAGTPDAPAVGPSPAGAAATRLEAVEVLSADGTAVIRISGDGEFPYSTFALGAPSRFVIDIDGVVNRSAQTTVPVAGGVVERVRVAQFKPLPKPVARVVFDLRDSTVPLIERTADALVVSFPAPGRPSVSALPATAAAPAEERRAEAVPMAPTPSPEPQTDSEEAPSDLALAPRPAETLAQATPPPAAPVRREPSDPRDPVIEIEEASAAPVAAAARPQAAPLAAASAAPGSQDGLGVRGPALQVLQPTSGTAGTGVDALSAQTAEGERVYIGEPIDLKVTNADVTDVLRTFAQISGLNIVIQPGVQGTVTAELENVPWDQALEQVLKINGLGYELEGNVMRIAPTSVLRQEAQERQQLAAARALSIPLRTILRRLSYADAGEVARLLQSGKAGLLSQRGSVIVDERTNTLIIKELPNFLDTVIAVIENLDTPEPQVMIEARIIETTKRFTRDLGIDWGFSGVADAAHGNTTGLIFPSNGNVDGGVNLGGTGNNGVLNLRLGNVLNTFQLDIALQAAESEGLINILSAPKVATLNNEQASIQSGLQIPIQTVANNTVTVQFVNATLRLDVTPQVTAEGTVLMDINISKREPQLAFLVPGATNAPIATKEARTRLVVRDGGTAVIGGIYRVSSDEGEDRVPGLANIPVVGYLFRNKSRREENEELLIFITPRVIKL